MSFMNNVMNAILKISNMKDMQNQKLDKGIDKLMRRSPKASQMKNLLIEEIPFKDRIISKISNKDGNLNNIDIIYFHGGCYCLQMQTGHWALATHISRETGATVYAVDYPLAPEYCGDSAINYAFEYYKYHIGNSNNRTILLGDSAGAGLATSLAMMIRDNKVKPADQLILLSPYLDTLCSDHRQFSYQKKDFFLSVKGLSRSGKIYIGNLKSDDFRVNPIHGSFKNLPPIKIFTSDRDILHVDSLRLVKILKDLNIEFELYEENNVMHDWMVIDQLPEAITARNKLVEYIINS
jgi:acetyl esterase/lipase